MRAFILVALLVVFAVVVMADDDEEKRGWWHKKCKSDSDCRRGQCCKGRCRMKCVKRCKSDDQCAAGQCCRREKYCSKCIKRCKSEDDCNEGQCCLKYRSTSRYGICRAYLQEGDKCYKKSYFGQFGLGKRSCGCAEGLECEIKKGGFFFYHRRYGKCVTAEGSGEM